LAHELASYAAAAAQWRVFWLLRLALGGAVAASAVALVSWDAGGIDIPAAAAGGFLVAILAAAYLGVGKPTESGTKDGQRPSRSRAWHGSNVTRAGEFTGISDGEASSGEEVAEHVDSYPSPRLVSPRRAKGGECARRVELEGLREE
jgi:hypothetical protein